MQTRFMRLVLLPLALLFSGLACASFGNGGSTDPNILFQDDFSTKDGGWAEIRDQDGIIDYDQDGYRIQVLDPNFEYWSFPGLNFSDASIEVDTRRKLDIDPAGLNHTPKHNGRERHEVGFI